MLEDESEGDFIDDDEEEGDGAREAEALAEL